ncbi:hypothetical protein FQZ97_1081960 [compost metagenome]
MKIMPSMKVAKPISTRPAISAAHKAMAPGFARQQRMLVMAAVTASTGRSSSSGALTTDSVNTMTANAAPTPKNASNSGQYSPENTTSWTTADRSGTVSP